MGDCRDAYRDSLPCQAQKELLSSKHDKDKCSERIAKLSSGIAVIRVGASTESEMRYLKDKIEDAVNATKVAIADGIVPGGASALIRAASKVSSDNKGRKFANQEIELGYKIIIKAMEEPLRQLAINAGREDGSLIVEKARSAKSNAGYDAMNDIFVDDMVEAGIVDPFRVTLSGVKNSVSAAAIFITAGAAIAIEPPENNK